jgi:hypothetical protein
MTPMWSNAEVRAFVELPPDEVDGWLIRNASSDRLPYLWPRVFEHLEGDLSQFREMSIADRLVVFDAAERSVEAALRSGVADPLWCAYWMVRFSCHSARNGMLSIVSGATSPDGAAKWALGMIPFTRERVLNEAAAYRRSPDVDQFPPDGASAEEMRALVLAALRNRPREKSAQDVLVGITSLVDAFGWMVDFVEDQDLADNLRAWIAIRGELAT